MYSCALWSDEEGGVNGDLTSGVFPGDLEAAQKRKIRYVLDKARLKPGCRVLEFGTGWGGLAIEVRRSLAHTEHDLNQPSPLHRRLLIMDVKSILLLSLLSRRRWLKKESKRRGWEVVYEFTSWTTVTYLKSSNTLLMHSSA